MSRDRTAPQLVSQYPSLMEHVGDASSEIRESTEQDLASRINPDPTALERAQSLAMRSLASDASIEWDDTVADDGTPLKVMRVASDLDAPAAHDAYVRFMRAWVRAEPSVNRRYVRVEFGAGRTG